MADSECVWGGIEPSAICFSVNLNSLNMSQLNTLKDVFVV